jgi:hypothetical protein
LVYQNSRPWEIEDLNTILISYRKSDGKGGMYDTLENGDLAFNLDYVTQGNCVTITLAEQVLNVSGKVDLTITFLSSNGEVISAFPMILDVAENPGTVATQESKDYFSLSVAIDAAIKATQEMFESKALIFEIEKDENGTYVFIGDVSYEDLTTAFDNGKVVFCRVNDPDISLSLFGVSDGIFNFYAMKENTVYSLTINADSEILLKSTSLATSDKIQDLEKTDTAHSIQLKYQQNAIDGNRDRIDKLESQGSGVHIGAEPPENPNVEVWINLDAGTTFQDAAAYDESIEVSEVKDHALLNLPCPVSDFEILQIHLTTKQAQFKLNMDVGGKSTFLANTQGGNSAGVHVLLMSTHDPDVMNLNVQTASYTENAQPSIPDRIAEVNKDAASIMLYAEDAGGGFQPGTTVHAWGIYKASGSAVIQIKDPETGEWKSIKAIQGEHGRDGSDYILTETDKQEIAEQAAGLVDVPEYELPVAKSDSLGGVQPVEKTEAMTNPVGVDALGGLWSAGGSQYRLLRKIIIDETNQTSTFFISNDENGNALHIDHLCAIAYIPKGEYNADCYVDFNWNTAYGYVKMFNISIDTDPWNWCLQVDRFGENLVMRGIGQASYHTPENTKRGARVIPFPEQNIHAIKIRTSSGNQIYPIGSTFEFYGY